jgi:ABC-type branched-subunit amino acid transport system permease subunit
MITYLVGVVTMGLILAILCLGLNVRWGWAGELDLSYYAFVAIGAYTYSVITLPPSTLPPPNTYILGLSMPFLVGVLGAMAASGLLSAVVGMIALRKVRGDYFGIVTVATSLILYAVISQESSLFNGATGLFGLDQPFNGALHLDPTQYSYFFLGLCLLCLIAVYVVLELLYNSPFGRSLRAIREDETAAAAFGRNVYVDKLKAFVIGGVVAGFGGSLLAIYLTAFNPASWSSFETFLLYAAIIVGGSANSRGVVLGTFVTLVLITETTRFLPELPGHPDTVPAVRNIAIGLLLIIALRWRPRGVLPERRPQDQAVQLARPTSVVTRVYALAVVAYAMFTGRRPFSGKTPSTALLTNLHSLLPRSVNPARGRSRRVQPGWVLVAALLVLTLARLAFTLGHTTGGLTQAQEAPSMRTAVPGPIATATVLLSLAQASASPTAAVGATGTRQLIATHTWVPTPPRGPISPEVASRGAGAPPAPVEAALLQAARPIVRAGPDGPARRYFPQTHHQLAGPFLRYWNAHLGAIMLGFPLTEPFHRGGATVQYVERGLMRLAAGGVTLAPLGRDLTAAHHFASYRWSALAPAFARYYADHLGPELLGAPLAAPDYEMNGDGSGRSYLAQWFERGRLEYHAETPARYSVLPGLVGQQALRLAEHG